MYGMFSPDKKAKSPVNKRKKSAGIIGTKKAPSKYWNQSYMEGKSPKRAAKTPNKAGMNTSYQSRISYSAGYGQKSFGFRSQYGGIGLKNNLIKSKSPMMKSTLGFGNKNNQDDRFANKYVQKRDKDRGYN
jgi:hypothetical protein